MVDVPSAEVVSDLTTLGVAIVAVATPSAAEEIASVPPVVSVKDVVDVPSAVLARLLSAINAAEVVDVPSAAESTALAAPVDSTALVVEVPSAADVIPTRVPSVALVVDAPAADVAPIGLSMPRFAVVVATPAT